MVEQVPSKNLVARSTRAVRSVFAGYRPKYRNQNPAI